MAVEIGTGLVALAAGVAMAGGALGTAWVQASVGSAAMGTIAERPEIGGSILSWYVIPETIVVLGFVIAFLLTNNLTSLAGAAAGAA